MSTTMDSKSEQLYERSARVLARANAKAERGKDAEELYRRAERLLIRANILKEQGK